MAITFSLANMPPSLYFILASMLSYGRGFPVAPHSVSLHPVSVALSDIIMPHEAFCHERAGLGAQFDFINLPISFWHLRIRFWAALDFTQSDTESWYIQIQYILLDFWVTKSCAVARARDIRLGPEGHHQVGCHPHKKGIFVTSFFREWIEKTQCAKNKFQKSSWYKVHWDCHKSHGRAIRRHKQHM